MSYINFSELVSAQLERARAERDYATSAATATEALPHAGNSALAAGECRLAAERSGAPSAYAEQVRAADAAADEARAVAMALDVDPADLCECGCGEQATTTVRLLREQDEGTAEALHWAESSIAPMRIPVRVVGGHEGDAEGYVSES